MIKNGWIQDKKIDGVPFRIDPIPKSNKTSRPQYKMTAKYINIHNTGNKAKGADAKAHTEYVDETKAYISWHFTVDDKEIFQELPIIESSWNAGDGRKGKGNRKGIAIEICENYGIDWGIAKENAIKLIAYLMKNVSTLYNKPVKPHQFFSGKYCPHRILDEGWNQFLLQIDKYKNNNVDSKIDRYKNIIQDHCNYGGPEYLWKYLDKYSYSEYIYSKWANSYKK